MIFQDSLVELEQQYNMINEHVTKDLYGITLLNFLSLPKEYQDAIMNAYCESFMKTNNDNSRIKEFTKKVKTLKKIKESKR